MCPSRINHVQYTLGTKCSKRSPSGWGNLHSREVRQNKIKMLVLAVINAIKMNERGSCFTRGNQGMPHLEDLWAKTSGGLGKEQAMWIFSESVPGRDNS